ncbi:MAG: hypothetical protein LBR18_06260 [Tannerella sp.]|nr:hypothetical protein [Tannerella sp.]
MSKKHKIVLFRYSQTGQATAIADRICEPLLEAGCEVVCKTITPVTPYPFPWSAMEFFQVFPEARLGIACPLQPIDLNDVQDADLVMIAGQSWYLSWSVPLHAFFQAEEIKSYLRGRNIVVINGCRNMWVKTQQLTREYIANAGGRYVGFIALQDRAANLVSVITIIRWLFYNKKAATRLLPPAGVSEADIEHSAVYGKLIGEALDTGSFNELQNRLVAEGAVTFLPSVYFIEENGYRLWGQWAKFILKKGAYGSSARRPWLRLFCCYLFFVLYVVSPIGMLFFYLTYPLRKKHLQQVKRENSSILVMNDEC